jgi:hypothetical protein
MGETVNREAAAGAQGRAVADSRAFQDGVIAGVLGAATVAIWFLVVYTINGRPLYTPTVLGTALFRHGEGLAVPARLPISLDMVLMFTWVYGLVLRDGGRRCLVAAVGGRATPKRRLRLPVHLRSARVGFIAAASVFAEPILHTLAWPAVLVANLLAAATMGGYFRLQHPHMRISP